MATTKWVLDPTHSEITFKVKHMMFTNVSGKFDTFQATAESDGDNFENARFDFQAETTSINTGNADRDNHLRGGDFFDAEQFPQLTFKSTAFQQKSGDDYTLTGDLSLHGVTKSISLDVEFGGLAQDPWGNTKAGLSATGKLNRKDFGLNWNAALEAGGVLVGEEVKLHIELQFVKQ
ncbi:MULTISPECIES: YceI family protein [unclassified Flavobacterium]|uniref:YceI family protein n=1 Tax=unclassified Flavobacterium TaxID=196869 RepID=UPI001F13D0E0|nr:MULTISPECIES: YceI family protein [unclassified Flavobacterium]UMY65208.1 YceI family protein [Flavobacterium sp. HJ-32-4]